MEKQNKISRIQQEKLYAKQDLIFMCLRGGGVLGQSKLKQDRGNFYILYGDLKIKVSRQVVMYLIDFNILIVDSSTSDYTYFTKRKIE